MKQNLTLDLSWKKISAIILLIFSSFAAGYYFSNSLKNIEVKKISIENKKKELLKKEKMFLEGERDKKINFIFNNFYAESILIKEFSGETIFEKKSDLILPIASLTKIFNAITALENTKNKTVLMTNRSLQAEGDYNIKPYEIFSMNDALRYMLIGSINDIASAISFGHTDLVNNWNSFVKNMNIFAKNNSMNSTLFFSENGLNITSHIMGAYSTAKDISKVTEYFYINYNSLAMETVKLNDNICSNKKCHYVENTNIILGDYPEIKFSKTGYTKLAGGSLAVIVEIKNKKYTVIILNSTKNGRFDDLKKIISGLKNL